MIEKVGHYLYCMAVLPLRIQEMSLQIRDLKNHAAKTREEFVEIRTIVNRCRHCNPLFIQETPEHRT